jgi:hypothetical protein
VHCLDDNVFDEKLSIVHKLDLELLLDRLRCWRIGKNQIEYFEKNNPLNNTNNNKKKPPELFE